MFEQKISVATKITYENIMSATSGELDKVLSNCLKNAGYRDLEFADLHRRHTKQGVAFFDGEHPFPIITLKAKDSYVAIGSYGREKTIPVKEIYTVYSCQDNGVDGNHSPASKVTASVLELGTNRCKVVKEITEYYPPTPKQLRPVVTSGHRASIGGAEKRRDQERRQARKYKDDYGMGPIPAPNGHDTTESITPPQEERNPRGIVFGKISRSRVFRVPVIENNIGDNPIPESQFKLTRRINNERNNHKDGTYDITQHSPNGGRTVTQHNMQGRRTQQITYNANGDVIKSKGIDGAAPTLAKPKRPKPSGALAKAHAAGRDWQRRLPSLRHHIGQSAVELLDDLSEERSPTPGR
mgnify:CR=1 FL=1